MYRITWRALALYTVIGTALGWGAWEAQAQAQTTPAPTTPRALRRGRSAIQALGNFLPQVAQRHGYSPARLQNLLLREPDLAVNDQGDLLYTCNFTPPPAGVRAEALADEAPVTALATSFQLHSRPGAQRTIFLDFDGHTTTGTQWNSDFNQNLPIVSQTFDTDGDPLTFSAAELTAIQTAWLRVAEDYAPFDVDVTTEDPGLEAIRRTNSNDTVYGVRVVITKGAPWYPTGGGVGYVGTFDRTVGAGSDWPCFVFYDRLSSTARYFAEASSHEAGHTLGLSHDGVISGPSYYEGAGDWAPIMGAAYYRNVTQFSKGEYALANNQEDDFAVMVSNGAAIRTDDHGNTFGTATTFDLNAGSATGVISTAADQDVFKLVVPAGTLRLRASTATLAQGANLDVALHLYDAGNNHLAGVNSDASLDATLAADVPAGTYYVVVSGSANGNVSTTGYSNYASIGSYTLALTPAPFTVTAPNGGETWIAGSSQAITWTTNVSGAVKLEYSTNSGSSWTAIQTSTPNDGTHTWTVPSSPTTQARVRVSLVSDSGSSDTSDADFSIQSAQVGTLTATSPNGGETWVVGASQPITWSSTNVSGNVKLEYSTNGGGAWTQISASTANDGSENWTVPNAVTTQGRIRVTSVSEPTVKDTSDANFTIQAPPGTVTVTAPNGGESWTAGTTQAITWTSTNVTGTIKLEYSTDGGSNWTLILAATSNDGTEPWSVPNFPTTQARVRVTSVTDPSATDLSNANFTLLPLPGSITVTAPNGGESWVGESTHAITWTSANFSGDVMLEYSLNGGSTWTTISASTANDGTENWVLPNAPTTQARVRVTSVNDGGVSDVSNANFTITAAPTPTLTVTAPNGSESLVVSTGTTITWISANVSGNVKLEYSTDDGSTWTTITVSTANDGTEAWTTPNVLTTQARVRVSAISDSGVNDISNANFSLVAAPVATVTVTAPNGGESWTVGAAQSLTWTSANLSGNVKLEYSVDGGSIWTVINANTANDGTEAWTVPNAPTTQARVRVTSLADGAVSDASNANFTIVAAPVASITVTAPNGGESWTVGSAQTITWTSANVSGNVKLEFSTDGGSIWTVINASTANDGTENWTPPGTGSTQARVRVSSVSNSGINDVSDNNFTLLYVGGKLTAPKKAAFGTLKLGKTKSVKLVLQNTAKTGNLVVNVTLSGAPFRIVSGGGTSTILPKKKLTVTVIYEPSAVGTATGTLFVTSSDPAKPSVSIPLTGKAK
jgi:hypothetical protein